MILLGVEGINWAHPFSRDRVVASARFSAGAMIN